MRGNLRKLAGCYSVSKQDRVRGWALKTRAASWVRVPERAAKSDELVLIYLCSGLMNPWIREGGYPRYDIFAEAFTRGTSIRRVICTVQN